MIKSRQNRKSTIEKTKEIKTLHEYVQKLQDIEDRRKEKSIKMEEKIKVKEKERQKEREKL